MKKVPLSALSLCLAACGATPESDELLGSAQEAAELTELQNVELYSPTDGVPASFIAERVPMVARVHGFGGTCTGTLLDDGLMLTAGHCDVGAKHRVDLGFQFSPDGELRPYVWDYVAENVEEIHRVGPDEQPVDFRLLRLFFNSERRWGATSISTTVPAVGDTIALIQHPGWSGNPLREPGDCTSAGNTTCTAKVVDTGHITESRPDGALRYSDVAQTGGASGGGIIKYPEGSIVGLHKGAGGLSAAWFSQPSSVIDGDKGSGALFSVGTSGLSQVSSLGNWSSSWRYLVPGRFDADTTDDLFFVNEANARFYRVTSSGSISALGSSISFANTWSQVIPVDLDGTGTTELFFYDARTGRAELWRPNGSGGMTRLMQNASFGPPDCRLAAAGDLLSNTGNELLLYCPKAGGLGDLVVYATSGTSFAKKFTVSTGLNDNYTQLIVGEFDATRTRSEIMVYDPWNSEVSFFKLGASSLTLIRKTTRTPPSSRLFTQIVAGDFTSQAGTELMFYDPGRGLVQDENLPGAAPGHLAWYSVSAGVMTLRGASNERHSLARIVPGKFQSGTTRTQIFAYDRYRQCLASSPAGHCYEGDQP